MTQLMMFFCMFWGVTIPVIALPGIGPFEAVMETLTLAPDSKHDKIKHNFHMTRVSRTKVMAIGEFDILEEVGPIGMVVNIERWGFGGFKPFMMEGLRIPNLCEDENLIEILHRFNGTAERLTKDCKLKPMKTFLKVDDIDRMAHEKVDKIVYGKYRITGYFTQGYEELAGFQSIFRFEPLSKGHGYSKWF